MDLITFGIKSGLIKNGLSTISTVELMKKYKENEAKKKKYFVLKKKKDNFEELTFKEGMNYLSICNNIIW